MLPMNSFYCGCKKAIGGDIKNEMAKTNCGVNNFCGFVSDV
jgi:hypothetical protein